MRAPLGVIRTLGIAAIVLFGAVQLGLPDWLRGAVPALGVGAALLLFRPPPRMRWGWHVALIVAVAATVGVALLAVQPGLLSGAALIGAAGVVGILATQRGQRPLIVVVLPLAVLALEVLPATRPAVETAGFFASSLGVLAYWLAPPVALVIIVATLHKPTIARLQQRWLDELRAEAEAAERAAKAERGY